jgi:two-component system, NtrC family, C4-dicarboxylate transport response regulator DctD
MKKSSETKEPKPTHRDYDRESHILIVDDDSSLLKFFKIHLNKFFSKILVVDNGKDALTAISEREIDVVLSDIRMPKIDGLALMEKIRKLHPEIPVLLISGEPIVTPKDDLVESADGFLTKPFSIEDLNAFINRGVDLRFAIKDMVAMLKNPKKIRDAMAGNEDALEKLVAKGSLAAAQKILVRLQSLKNS